MSTTMQTGSATVYQFPARGRFAKAAAHNENAALASLIEPRISYGSWYHDEAIEAERARKN